MKDIDEHGNIDKDSQIELESEYLIEFARLKKAHRKDTKIFIFIIISVFMIFLVGGLLIYQDTNNYYDNTMLIDKSYALKGNVIDKLQKQVAIVSSVEILKEEYSQPTYIINCVNNNGQKFIIKKSENELSFNKTLAAEKKEYVEYKFLKTEQKLLSLDYKKTFLYDTEKLVTLMKNDGLDVVKSGYYKVSLYLHK